MDSNDSVRVVWFPKFVIMESEIFSQFYISWVNCFSRIFPKLKELIFLAVLLKITYRIFFCLEKSDFAKNQKIGRGWLEPRNEGRTDRRQPVHAKKVLAANHGDIIRAVVGRVVRRWKGSRVAVRQWLQQGSRVAQRRWGKATESRARRMKTEWLRVSIFAGIRDVPLWCRRCHDDSRSLVVDFDPNLISGDFGVFRLFWRFWCFLTFSGNFGVFLSFWEFFEIFGVLELLVAFWSILSR